MSPCATHCFLEALFFVFRKEVVLLIVQGITVEKRIAEAEKFRVYLGTKADGQKVILKVAKTFEDNNWLATEASWFELLRHFTDKVDWFEDVSHREKSHYDWLLAKLDKSFMEPSQDDRRINVYVMPNADLDSLVSLRKLYDQTEIDARSSAWIIGRLFKLYSMFELIAADSENLISNYPLFSLGNFFIGPEKHNLICYNFSGDMPDVLATEFIKAIAKDILGWVVVEDDPSEQKYYELLEDFSEHGRETFRDAHRDLYLRIGGLWGHKYHPFTYRNRGTATWKTIKEEK